MITKTVDSIVREALQENGLSMHYYHSFLLHGLTELQRLSLRHGMSAKQVELPVNDYKRGAFPEDMVHVIDVGIKEGERILPCVMDDSLNKLYNFDGSGNKIAHPKTGEDDDSRVSLIDYLNDYYNDSQRYSIGGFYGLKAPQDRTYGLDFINNEFVFSNQFDRDVFVLTYAVDPVSTSAANIVRYEYVDTIKSYMNMKYKDSKPRMFTLQDRSWARDEYKNQKRAMKSLIYKMSRADFYYSIRKGIHGAIKN